MTELNDDCWLLVFQEFNLNERRNVRLTCKRFRFLCDQIKIHKLIIYEKLKPMAGRLRYTNEPYGLEHTAYVVNLNRFFNDEQIAFKQMRPIQSLVVHGDSGFPPVDLKIKFEQLNYLELHHCNFLSPILLSSAKLEYLTFDHVNLRPFEQIEQIEQRAKKIRATLSDESLFWFAMGFEDLASKSLKYLSLAPEIDTRLPIKAISLGIFDNLEEADVSLPDCGSTVIFARSAPKLRTFNCMIEADEVQTVVDIIAEKDTSKYFSMFGEELTVYLFGLQFSQTNKSTMIGFLKPFGKKIQVHDGRMAIQVDQQIYKHIKKWRKKRNLEQQFFKMVDTISLAGDGLAFDGAFFRRFSYCRSLLFPTSPRPADFERYLDTLTNLKMIHLRSRIHEEMVYGNKLLNLIGQKCPQLETLLFESWEKIDFGFLFKLQRLKHLHVLLAYTFPQDTLIDLLRKHRDLAKFDVCFIRSNSESKSQLSAFKKRVNETFSERFKARKLGFHVQIHTRVDQYVRCVLKEDHESIKQIEEDEAKMFGLLEFMKAQMVFNFQMNKKKAIQKMSVMEKKAYDKIFD